MINLKVNKFSSSNRFLEEAYRARVKDEPYMVKSPAQIESETQSAMESGFLREIPMLKPGGIMSSRDMREFVKDAKVATRTLASETTELKNELDKLERASSTHLLAAQLDSLELDALLLEDELRSIGWTYSHVANWSRYQDQSRTDVLQDPKARTTFQPQEKADLNRAGLSLPILASNNIEIKSLSLNASARPIMNINLDSLLIHKPAYIVLASDNLKETIEIFCVFNLRVEVNKLELTVLAQNNFSIDSISYQTVIGTWEALTIYQQTDLNSCIVNFAPVRTNALKLTITQAANTGRGIFESRDELVTSVNQFLSTSGFNQLLPSSTEVINGNVFDFSIKDLSVSLIQYRSRGWYISQEQLINSNILDLDADIVSFNNSFEGTIKPESWLMTDSHFFPIPLDKEGIYEMLHFTGDTARLQFFPRFSIDDPIGIDSTELGSLTIGDDYLISIDNGETWLDEFPDASIYEQVDWIATYVLIKLLDHDVRTMYKAYYTMQDNQYLTSDKKWRYIDTEAIGPTVSACKVVFILRAQAFNPYVTPLVTSWTLKGKNSYVS